MIVNVLWILACQLSTEARPASRTGMRHRTKKQYVHIDISCVPSFHHTSIVAEETNSSILSQNLTLLRLVQRKNACSSISLTAGGMTISTNDLHSWIIWRRGFYEGHDGAPILVKIWTKVPRDIYQLSSHRSRQYHKSILIYCLIMAKNPLLDILLIVCARVDITRSR